MQSSPLHSVNFTVWRGFIAVFILGLIIFGEIGPFRLINVLSMRHAMIFLVESAYFITPINTNVLKI